MNEEIKSVVVDATEEFTKLLNEHREETKRLREEISSKAKKVMQNAFKAFFEKYPEVSVVAWTQYTPYFNDGETSYFSVSDIYYICGDVDVSDIVSPYDLEEADEFEDGWHFPHKPDEWIYKNAKERPDDEYYQRRIAQYEAALEKANDPKRVAEFEKDWDVLANYISSIEDELEIMFGDHAMILVTKDGVSIEEYVHD